LLAPRPTLQPINKHVVTFIPRVHCEGSSDL